MKIFSIFILFKTTSKPVKLNSAFDLKSFGFFQRSSIQEFMNFTAELIVERAEKSTKYSVKEKNFMCHCYTRPDNLSGVCITDEDYPSNAAFSFLMKILSEFSEKYSSHLWSTSSLNSLTYDLDSKLILYQDPKEADMLIKIQAELDQTKQIVLNTVEEALARGEKLDDLIAKSESLTAHSKMFYKTAVKVNKCC